MSAASSTATTQHGHSRSLTEVFILMRNNAIQSKHIFAEPSVSTDDRMSLVALDGAAAGSAHLSRIPPDWVNMADEVQYEMSRVRSRINDVRETQKKHILRPNFADDDNSIDEMNIRAGAEQIMTMLSHCQRMIANVGKAGSSPPQSPGQRQQADSDTLRHNVVRAMLAQLQTLTMDFRSSQSGYVRQLQTREDSYSQYFGVGSDVAGGALFSDDSPLNKSSGSSLVNDALDINALERGEAPPQMTMAQLELLEQNSTAIDQREREVLTMTKTIVHLNELFRDVAAMTAEQGGLVDRIDFNVEQSALRTRSALTHVQTAEKHQRKNRKMLVIVILAGLVLLLFFLLVVTKLR